MSIARALRAMLVLVAVPALALLLLSTGSAQEGSSDLLIKVVVPQASISEGATDISVSIVAENARNLAAFGFQLKYDPDVIEIATDAATGQPLVQRGDFLGSTDREVACPEPTSQPGVLRMLCVTLRLEPPGPDGNGTLATVTFNAVGAGSTDLTLDNVRANEPDATEIKPIQVQSAALEVTGGGSTNWLLWAIIGGAGALVVVGAGVFALLRSGRPAPASQPPAAP